MYLIYWLITETEEAIQGNDPQQRRKMITVWGFAVLISIIILAVLFP